MFIDSHCHIDFMKDIPGIIKRARKNGVEIIINNGINVESNRKTLELAEKYPEIKVALGIYPIDALGMTEGKIKEEIEFIIENREKIIAIGEVGIDLKWSRDLKNQEKNFRKFVDLALKIDKPLIVHARGAEKEIVDILEENKCKKVIMHCFSGDMKLVERIVNNGWFLTIPTNVTFSEHFQKIIEKTPISQLLCETDSPYLHPIKGKRDNEPGNVIESYGKIGKIKKLSLKRVENEIGENFKRLFG